LARWQRTPRTARDRGLAAARRLEREQPQQRHRKPGRLVRAQRQIRAPLRADLICKLDALRREAPGICRDPVGIIARRRTGDRLDDGDPMEDRRELIERGAE
jgi:hypothetical protein